MKKIVVTPSREIHVQKKIWNGQEILDIRTYLKTEKYTGYTKKGVTVPPNLARELAQAIIEETEREGA